MEITVTGLAEWRRDLLRAADTLDDAVAKVVGRGAFNVKRDWARRWSGLHGLPRLAASISYDIERAGGLISADIGPNLQRTQGPLGHLIEFGTEYGTVHNAPHPGGLPALEAEQEGFVDALETVLMKALT